MKTPRFAYLRILHSLIFPIILIYLTASFTLAGKEPQSKLDTEIYEARILKVYTAKSEKDTPYIGYVINWNGSEVVVPAMYGGKAKKVGEVIKYSVSEMNMPFYSEDGSFRMIKVLQFIVVPPFIENKQAERGGAHHSQFSTSEVEGSKAERVAAVTKIISRTAPPPSPILDAHFVEEKFGDGIFGPSDFRSFCALTVAPDDLAAWRSALKPIEQRIRPTKLDVPKQAQPWWVSPNDFRTLEFYSPKSLTGRYNGWVGIAPDGRIFVYSFTM